MTDGSYTLNLPFWGLCLIALLSPRYGALLLDDITDPNFELPVRDEHYDYIARILKAIRSEALSRKFKERTAGD